ncbi:DUF928 domain-containing protein [Calothrix sp. UHCC 0171]|uniref:DUF928 domain-containing protein n=1 Tax=Calothrix sp. UHCC 0171 TaxID=3110245 RepID=UPI002B220FB2|nr:DUF928 domain-containing protein [Calothrix sp. UHCC 0171]MEA5570718.1 DUF928 domain-containing protein [Calothrix sp. UHCC 0171]
MVTNLTIPTWAANPMPANFEPPPRRDAPRGGTAGGGSRPVTLACASTLSNQTPVLAALSPGKYIGLSRLQRPVFFVLLPPSIAQSAEFSLFDGEMNGIYQTRIPISDRNGLISINLPEDAPPLVKNKIYYWSFAVTCNPSDRTEDWVVGGWIEHVPLDQTLQQQLAQASAIERVSLYAKQAFWYDAVATIIELQHQQPSNTQISQSWKELFTSVGLSMIATAN